MAPSPRVSAAVATQAHHPLWWVPMGLMLPFYPLASRYLAELPDGLRGCRGREVRICCR